MRYVATLTLVLVFTGGLVAQEDRMAIQMRQPEYVILGLNQLLNNDISVKNQLYHFGFEKYYRPNSSYGISFSYLNNIAFKKERGEIESFTLALHHRFYSLKNQQLYPFFIEGGLLLTSLDAKQKLTLKGNYSNFNFQKETGFRLMAGATLLVGISIDVFKFLTWEPYLQLGIFMPKVNSLYESEYSLASFQTVNLKRNGGITGSVLSFKINF